MSCSGSNPMLRQGPQDNLLQLDYEPWDGPNMDLRNGQSVKPKGPKPRVKDFSLAKGPAGVAKGPRGLAKGSNYKVYN